MLGWEVDGVDCCNGFAGVGLALGIAEAFTGTKHVNQLCEVCHPLHLTDSRSFILRIPYDPRQKTSLLHVLTEHGEIIQIILNTNDHSLRNVCGNVQPLTILVHGETISLHLCNRKWR